MSTVDTRCLCTPSGHACDESSTTTHCQRCPHPSAQREEAASRSNPGAKPWPALLCVRGDEEHLPLAPKSVDCEWGAALGRMSGTPRASSCHKHCV